MEKEEKMEELLKLLDNDERVIKLKKLKKKLFLDQDLLDKVSRLQHLDIYSDEYKELKKELFLNQDYVEYQHLENEIHLLILEMNQRLKKLTNERKRHHENY